MMDAFKDPAFTFPQAVQLTDVDRKTIENWMTHGHISPSGDLSGRGRRFSLKDLLMITLLQRLRTRFNVQAVTASFIAGELVEEYSSHAEKDLTEIWGGGAIGATAYRITYGMTKDASGELRGTMAEDVMEDDVMIVVPVGLLARGLFAKAKVLMDAAAAATEQGQVKPLVRVNG